MRLLTPDADEVFGKFIQQTDNKKVKKFFGIDKSAITAAEYVKNVDKSGFFFFTSKVDPKGAKSIKKKDLKSMEISAKKISKERFYSFKESISESAWKGKDKVLLSNRIKKITCDKCNGKGFKPCDKCKGKTSITCEDCKGKGSYKCNKCDNEDFSIEIEVIEVDSKGKERKKILKLDNYVCGNCLGAKEIKCKTCNSHGTIVCYECYGKGKITCSACGGVGFSYEVFEGVVPIKIEGKQIPHTFTTKRDKWMLNDKELSTKIDSAETYSFKNLDNFKDNEFEELYGVPKLDKDLQKLIEETKKNFESLEKEFKKGKGSERPLFPIDLVILLRLQVESQKGKKCDVYALGTKNKWTYVTNGI